MKCLSLEILAGTSVWVLTSKGTGTVRSAVKPPLVARDGERKPDASYNPVPPFTPIRGNQGSLSGFPSLSYGMPSSNENGKDHDKSSEISYTEDIHLTSSNLGPSGTVVVRSSRESLSSSVRFTSSEDTFGTVVFRDQPNEPETGTPRSRLGVQERISSSSFENSATNLAEAKAALQGGLRKVNVRERSTASKITNKSSELKNNSGTDRYISNKVSATGDDFSLPKFVYQFVKSFLHAIRKFICTGIFCNKDSQVLSDDKVVKQYL